MAGLILTDTKGTSVVRLNHNHAYAEMCFRGSWVTVKFYDVSNCKSAFRLCPMHCSIGTMIDSIGEMLIKFERDGF